MNPDDIDHAEHRAVQAHIDAEQASEAIHERLQELAELLDRISTLVENSRATINTAAAHDRFDDTEDELVGLERDKRSISPAPAHLPPIRPPHPTTRSPSAAVAALTSARSSASSSPERSIAATRMLSPSSRPTRST